ncbi:hypothetical protein [Rathayibacter sp. PhB127]|uniref:hypothetical protein n=1 Tax=Rathayibacter sp. PhB127 TaxID=2485176 RepID=UPI0011CEC744|nr:hypothetical protein [Rathayibacter sp. PhB127]
MADPTAGIGSIADWVSGIGTLGALIVALGVWINDIRTKRRHRADQFVLTVRPTNTKDAKESDIRFRFKNNGDAEIYEGLAIYFNGTRAPSMVKLGVERAGGGLVLSANQSESDTMKNVGAIAGGEIFAVFQDAEGRWWMRHLVFKGESIRYRFKYTSFRHYHRRMTRYFMQRSKYSRLEIFRIRYRRWSRIPWGKQDSSQINPDLS